LENGKYNPSLKLAKLVSLALESSIDEVFVFEEEELK
jgi:DNA-binding XRE family transcriptional regulator